MFAVTDTPWASSLCGRGLDEYISQLNSQHGEFDYRLAPTC